jgi:GTP diphosphokinase / guanosine-3',5'-bis(diphosphate) 3'-diphosphatase
MGVLAQVAAQIAASESNIDHVNVTDEGDSTSILTFEIEVRDRTHLSQVIRAIREMGDVLRVVRTMTGG